MKLNLNNYIKSLRAYSLTISAGPALLGFACGFYETFAFRPGTSFLFLICLAFIHAGVNILNDYYDYTKGVDYPGAPGPSGLLTDGTVKPGLFLFSGRAHLTAGICLGLVLVLLKGLPLLIPSIAGVLIAWFYTHSGPNLKYSGLGEAAVFLAMGPLIGMAAYYTVTGFYSPRYISLYSVPGLLAAAILLINNIRDRNTDRKAGISTFTVIFGKYNSIRLLSLLFLLPYMILPFSVVFLDIPVFSLTGWITIPSAAVILYRASKAAAKQEYTTVLHAAVLHHLGVTIVLTAAVIVEACFAY